MRRIVLPLLALLLAGTSTFAIRTWLEERRQAPAALAQPAPEQRKGVLVAARNLDVGMFVQPDALRWQDWPDVATPESYLVRGRDDEATPVGAVVRRPLAVGQPLTLASV